MKKNTKKRQADSDRPVTFAQLKQALKPLLDETERNNKRFEQIDKKFEQVDKRFNEIDRRFDIIETHLEMHDRRFISINARFEALEKKGIMELFVWLKRVVFV